MHQSALDYELVFAAHRGDNESILKALKAGARTRSWDERALREAALGGHKSTVQLLIKHGAEIGDALIWAAKTGNIVTAARLIGYAPVGTSAVITLRTAFAHVASFEAAIAAGTIDEAPPPSNPYLTPELRTPRNTGSAPPRPV